MTARVTYTNGNVLNASDLTNAFVYLPYAMESGRTVITGNGTIPYTSGRFTQDPVIIATCQSSASSRTSVTVAPNGTTSFTAYVWNGTSAATSAATIHWTAIQMTDSNGVG